MWKVVQVQDLVSPSLDSCTSIVLRTPPDTEVSGSTSTSTPRASTPTWGPGVTFVDPGALANHPYWREVLGAEGPDIEDELRASVRDTGATHPLIVTGVDCASPPGTILDGHRRRQALLDARVALVPVITRTDLTAEAEQVVILKSALASQQTRKLSQSQRAKLEGCLRDVYSQGRGFRSDLATSVGTNASSRRADALALVADASGETRNSVADRAKVFSSPVTPSVLQDAVDAGSISLTRAAALVRDAERADQVREVIQQPRGGHDEATVVAAREEVACHTRNILAGRPARVERPTAPPKRPKDPSTITLPLDGTPVSVRLGGRTVTRRVVEVTVSEVRILEYEEPAEAKDAVGIVPSTPPTSAPSPDQVQL